ncbi:MAG: hypothetical protein KBF75_14435, partial [Saprospiraceae bacterium]|nr:hypothetical protein [Saprospiraceae bacterium]
MHQLYVLFNSFNLARICIIYLFTTNISAQINENFNFNHISSISQLSNYHLFNTSNKKVLISSTEGLNIFDGLNVKIYRPSTHRMYGYNIQSPFFEDSDGKVWFTTYEALNYYDPRTDDLDYMFMVSSREDTIKENYSAFHLEENRLYLKAGKQIFVVDVSTKRVVQSYAIDFSKIHDLTLLDSEKEKYILGAGVKGYEVYKIEPTNSVSLIDSGNINSTSILSHRDGLCWIGDASGKIRHYDVKSSRFLYSNQVSSGLVNGISYLSDTKLLISGRSNQIYVFDIHARIITDSIVISSTPFNAPVKLLLTPYMDPDSTLWIGSDGQGVLFHNFNKSKFKHYLGSTNEAKSTSVIKIFQQDDKTFITLNRNGGIQWLTESGQKLKQWNKLPTGISDFTAITGVQLNDRQILFASYGRLYVLDLHSKEISALSGPAEAKQLEIGQLERLSNGKIIVSCFGDLMQEIILEGNTYSLQPYGDLSKYSDNTTYFKIDLHNRLYISNDELSILVFVPSSDGISHVFERELKITGGIRGLCEDPQSNAVYISNSQGLFRINRETWTIDQIKGKNNILTQTIYSVLADDDGNLWLSSNKGLMKYYPATDVVKVFTEMDGIQAQEYNTHAYLKTADGHMLFGGVNGLNYFHPDEVRFSTKPAPVYISELLINDETDTTYRAPQYVEVVDLKYTQNTFSFEFHAIDYADPAATRVRYKLIGVDDEYVESKSAQGFARYANLRPGSYTFSILGQNADGVWNENPRELPIIIHPPFWLTWWFITLSSLSIISLIYWTVRSYYRRKLEKKNLLLREQALIIKNQQAIEHERTRIASEMHDDLGSGLTTIRYLSDKALMQAKDTEEAEQIQRIADHSNTLVRNMSEIIWAMNSRFDDAENLAGYLRRYASEYLEEHSIPFSFDIDEEQLTDVNVRGEVRRNLFLVFKEVLHNTVKYSGAAEVIIHLHIDDHVTIKVSEVGARGFDPISSEVKGNGLYNIKKRMDAIQGRIT